MSQICLPSTPSTRHKSHVPKTYSTRTSEPATSHRGKLCQLIRSNDWLPLRHEGFCYFFVSSARQPASQTTNFPSFVRRVWSTFGKLQTAAFIKLTSVFFFFFFRCHAIWPRFRLQQDVVDFGSAIASWYVTFLPPKESQSTTEAAAPQINGKGDGCFSVLLNICSSPANQPCTATCFFRSESGLLFRG